jgi:hypothetical protein
MSAPLPGSPRISLAVSGKMKGKMEFSDRSYRGEAYQHLDLDLVGLEVKGYFRIRKVLQ